MRSTVVLMMSLMVGCGGKGAAVVEPEPAPAPEDNSADEPEARPTPAPTDRVPASSAAAAFLDAHNEYRKRHCAPPLEWSEELAKVAQKWANALRDQGCAFEHSRTRYGENLAAGTSGALDPGTTTEMWYREVDIYDFKKPGFSMATGHFTQLVWAGTTSLGCGMSTCKGLDIIVCNYDPPGNVERGYQRNVKPAGCK